MHTNNITQINFYQGIQKKGRENMDLLAGPRAHLRGEEQRLARGLFTTWADIRSLAAEIRGLTTMEESGNFCRCSIW